MKGNVTMWLPDKIALFLSAASMIGLLGLSTHQIFLEDDIKVENPIHPVARLTIHESNIYKHASTVHIGDGYFITVAHMILDKEKPVYIEPQTYKDPVKSEILWVSDLYDVAFLYSPELSHIDNYELSCEKLVVGEELEFHGNPQSQNYISTWGKVAGTKRNIEEFGWKEVVPVSGNIVPGMSGGSVTNLERELVGINAGFLSHPITPQVSYSMTGISFIIPSSAICKLLNKTE